MLSAWRPSSWSGYPKCNRCDAAAGTPCVTTRDTVRFPRGQRKVKPHSGRIQTTKSRRGRLADEGVTADRLIVWKRLAPRGVPVADIAHQLGMNRAALDRFILRARKRGHPDAVYHERGHPRAKVRRT